MSDSVALSASEFTLDVGKEGYVIVSGEGHGSVSVVNEDHTIAKGSLSGVDLMLEGVKQGVSYVEVRRGSASAKIKVIVV